MQVDLSGKKLRVLGEGGALAAGFSAALTEAGAIVSQEAGGAAPVDLLVSFSQLGNAGAGWLAELAAGAQALAEDGRVLNVVSVTGLVPMRGDATAPAQAAVIALTRSLALDCAPRGVRVNALAVPADEAARRRMATHVPNGRPPADADIVRAGMFLLDPENTYTTGHVLVADRGWSIGFARDF